MFNTLECEVGLLCKTFASHTTSFLPDLCTNVVYRKLSADDEDSVSILFYS